jgi:hypothetical protein
MINKALHRKLTSKQHETDSGAPDGWEVPALLGAPVVLLLNEERTKRLW